MTKESAPKKEASSPNGAHVCSKVIVLRLEKDCAELISWRFIRSACPSLLGDKIFTHVPKVKEVLDIGRHQGDSPDACAEQSAKFDTGCLLGGNPDGGYVAKFVHIGSPKCAAR